MFYFLKLAFGNVVKNRRNTLTITIVVAICVFFMEFLFGYMDGFKVKIANDALQQTGHVVVYNEKYYNDLDFAPLDYNIQDYNRIVSEIKKNENVDFVRPEINFGAMANSVKENSETMVKAVDYTLTNPVYEKKKKAIVKGRFIEKDDEFVVGKKLAEILGVSLNERIILLTVDKYGSMNATEGTVVGLLQTRVPAEDESLIICSLASAQNLLGMEGSVTEIVVNLKDYMGSDSRTAAKRIELKDALRKDPSEKNKKALDEFNDTHALVGAEKTAKELEKDVDHGLVAIPWQEEQPMIAMMFDMLDASIVFIVVLILLVAAMGISNSFLMNIMGRMPEFGVMRAMGLSGKQLFSMIVSESFVLGMIGSVAGLIPAAALVHFFEVHPIDYGAMAEAFENYEGLSAVIGTDLNLQSVIVVFVTGVLISIFASIYPARQAIKKKTVDVLRGVR